MTLILKIWTHKMEAWPSKRGVTNGFQFYTDPNSARDVYIERHRYCCWPRSYIQIVNTHGSSIHCKAVQPVSRRCFWGIPWRDKALTELAEVWLGFRENLQHQESVGRAPDLHRGNGTYAPGHRSRGQVMIFLNGFNMRLKQCHKPAMTGNALYNLWNGDLGASLSHCLTYIRSIYHFAGRIATGSWDAAAFWPIGP